MKLGGLCFPVDFPGTEAYLRTMSEIYNQQSLAALKRPKHKQADLVDVLSWWKFFCEEGNRLGKKYSDSETGISIIPTCFPVNYLRDHAEYQELGLTLNWFLLKIVGKGNCMPGSLIRDKECTSDGDMPKCVGFVVRSSPPTVGLLPEGLALCLSFDPSVCTMEKSIQVQNPKSSVWRKGILKPVQYSSWEQIIL